MIFAWGWEVLRTRDATAGFCTNSHRKAKHFDVELSKNSALSSRASGPFSRHPKMLVRLQARMALSHLSQTNPAISTRSVTKLWIARSESSNLSLATLSTIEQKDSMDRSDSTFLSSARESWTLAHFSNRPCKDRLASFSWSRSAVPCEVSPPNNTRRIGSFLPTSSTCSKLSNVEAPFRSWWTTWENNAKLSRRVVGSESSARSSAKYFFSRTVKSSCPSNLEQRSSTIDSFSSWLRGPLMWRRAPSQFPSLSSCAETLSAQNPKVATETIATILCFCRLHISKQYKLIPYLVWMDILCGKRISCQKPRKRISFTSLQRKNLKLSFGTSFAL